MPAFATARAYAVNAVATVLKSPRISDGAAAAIASKTFAASVILVFAFPDAAPNALANLAPRLTSSAQFFLFAKVGAAVGVAPSVVVAADVVVAVADVVAAADPVDFFPPQPAAITTKATTKMETSVNLIAERILQLSQEGRGAG